MFGAIMAKRKAGSGFDAWNTRDMAKMMAGFAEDATWSFPGNTAISGEIKGKKAIEAAITKALEQFPKQKFTVKEVFVSNIFAMGSSNNIAIEYDLIETNREGKEFHHSAVSIVRVKGGKDVEMKDYIFNTELLNEAWKKV